MKNEIKNGTNLNELLIKLKIQKTKVAIEVNGEIVEKKKYPNLFLNTNDKVEIVHFIGGEMRLEPVILSHDASIDSILSYFMGKNTQQRQEFIIDNLRVEKDKAEAVNSDKKDEETNIQIDIAS